MPVLTLYATKCRTKTSLISQLGPSDTEECLRSMQAGKVNLTPLAMLGPPLACSRGGLLQPTVRWLLHSSAKAAWGITASSTGYGSPPHHEGGWFKKVIAIKVLFAMLK